MPEMMLGLYRNLRTDEVVNVTSEDQAYALGKTVFAGNDNNIIPNNKDYCRFMRWYEYVGPAHNNQNGSTAKERIEEAQRRANAQRKYL
jgi:hypothetical protein